MEWHLYAEWCSKGTSQTAAQYSKLSLTLMRRLSRLEAGQQLLLVETCCLEALRNGELTELVLQQAAGHLAELDRSHAIFGQESLRLSQSRPTTTQLTR